MKTTISQLFDAIHYCNKFVKTDNCTDNHFKKDFYGKKRDLVYHMIKNHKSSVAIKDFYVYIIDYSGLFCQLKIWYSSKKEMIGF